MIKIKTTLLFLTISLFSFTGFGQTMEFTDEASFLAALGSVTPTLEDYENCPAFSGFNFTSTEIFNCLSGCDDGVGMFWSQNATFVFDEPKNVFGTEIYDLGNVGPTTLTLMTDDGQSYTVVQDFDVGNEQCGIIFYGIISDMNFVMAIFTNSNPEDNMLFDNTYCANTLAPIPTLSQWGIIALGMLTLIFGVVMIRQRKTLFA